MSNMKAFMHTARLAKSRPSELERENERLQKIASENAEQCRVWSEVNFKRMDQIARLESEIAALESCTKMQQTLINKIERAMADQEEEIDILQQRVNGLTHALHLATAPSLEAQDRMAP
jgi:uncharacterized coiled-coil protein SlyX